MKIETLAVHGGYTPDPSTKAAAVPIYQAVAFAFDDTQHGADLFDLKVAGNIYSRIMNPTNAVLEARLAAMDGGIGVLAVASGMSAIAYAIQTIAETGDNIVSSSTLYGGTYNLFAHTFPQMGIEERFADPRDPASCAPLMDARTKAVFANRSATRWPRPASVPTWCACPSASSTSTICWPIWNRRWQRCKDAPGKRCHYATIPRK
jgi:O-acetylhomoserine (thiol)-lyase